MGERRSWAIMQWKSAFIRSFSTSRVTSRKM